MQKTQIAIIVAMDEHGGIGLNGDMPWRLSADLRRFKKITLGHPVIMGRRTFESLPGGALPGRTNIVVSSTPGFQPRDAVVVDSPEKAFESCAGKPLCFIIGGGTLYRHFIKEADTLHITMIHNTYPADTFFPTEDLILFELTDNELISDDETFPFPYEFRTYRRKLHQQG